jgi:cell division septum initiation protein DivIVA
MLRQDASRTDPDLTGTSPQDESRPSGPGGIDIQRELNRLEEMILDSPRIPLTRRTLIDEEIVLDQLDLVRLNLPAAYLEAEEIMRRREEILGQAERYAQEILAAAEQEAAQILDEMGLIRQAKQEADQIRQQVEQECELVREETIAEIERVRRQAQQEIEEMRNRAMAECQEIHAGADDYADRVLRNIELQLGEMMRVIQNGRQQLHQSPAVSRQPDPPPAVPPPARPAPQTRPTDRPKH